MKLIPVFDMRKLTDDQLNIIQHITERYVKHCGQFDKPHWHQQYHMCRVKTMERQGYGCCQCWITYVPRSKVRKPSDNVKAYKEGKWTL